LIFFAEFTGPKRHPGLYQSPFAMSAGPQFGDTAANGNSGSTGTLPPHRVYLYPLKRLWKPAAGLWRIVLMPIDAPRQRPVDGADGLSQLDSVVKGRAHFVL
jgi:hypothetical protein